MTKRITDEIEKNIFQDYIFGMPQSEISKKYNLSESYVSKLLKTPKHSHNKFDLKSIHTVTNELKERNIPVDKLHDLLHIDSVLKKIDISPDRVIPIIDQIPLNESPQEFLEAIPSLLQLKKDTGMDISEIMEKCDSLREESRQLTQNIELLKNKQSDAQKSAKKALDDSNSTIADLEVYRKQKSALTVHGIDSKDIDGLTDMINTAKNSGFDSRKITDYLKHKDIADSELDAVLKKKEIEQEKLEQTKNEILKHEQKLQDDADLVAQVKSLKKHGISPLLIESLLEAIRLVYEKHGLDGTQAIKKLSSDLVIHYDKKLGLDTRLEKIKHELEQKEIEFENIKKQRTKSIQNLDSKINNLKEKRNKIENEVNSLKDQKHQIQCDINAMRENTEQIQSLMQQEIQKYTKVVVDASEQIGHLSVLSDISDLFFYKDYKKALVAMVPILDALLSFVKMQTDRNLPLINSISSLKQNINKQISKGYIYV